MKINAHRLLYTYMGIGSVCVCLCCMCDVCVCVVCMFVCVCVCVCVCVQTVHNASILGARHGAVAYVPLVMNGLYD